MPEKPPTVVDELDYKKEDSDNLRAYAECNDNTLEETKIATSGSEIQPIATESEIETRAGPTRRSGYPGLVAEIDPVDVYDATGEDGRPLSVDLGVYNTGDPDWFWVLEEVNSEENLYYVQAQVLFGVYEYFVEMIAYRQGIARRRNSARNGTFRTAGNTSSEGRRSVLDGDGAQGNSEDEKISVLDGDNEPASESASINDETFEARASEQHIDASVGQLNFLTEFSDPNVDVSRKRQTAEHEVIAGSESSEDFAVQAISQKPPEINITGHIAEVQTNLARATFQTEVVSVETNRWSGDGVITEMSTNATNLVYENEKVAEITFRIRAVDSYRG